ncbi:hypothetical protein SAMN05444004_101285 [Jannaschia faecimaris]|uniref:Ferrochelatase n=1 Tax=Jannaschia faecimaris TaxID=1244108 RepID=A0A1H3JCK0_9RHOB|nr:hypothetical protein [Jannaschia faecimaris]SDY37666.1 hypothetical protein SAMN05444004_101285 [Jannaschia faecimaris]
MKKLALATALTFASTAAFAGNPAPAPVEPVVIVEDTSSSSAGIIVPILAIILLAAAASD